MDKDILQILKTSRVIAVVGLSPNVARPSYGVTQFLINKGYEIYGVNPGHTEILGRPCFASLKEVPKPIHIVDVFRNSEAVPAIVDEAIALKAKCIWLQEGVTHPEAEEKARQAGLFVISDHCILKEHRRLLS
jgi:predicted CoA-binding protein